MWYMLGKVKSQFCINLLIKIRKPWHFLIWIPSFCCNSTYSKLDEFSCIKNCFSDNNFISTNNSQFVCTEKIPYCCIGCYLKFCCDKKIDNIEQSYCKTHTDPRRTNIFSSLLWVFWYLRTSKISYYLILKNKCISSFRNYMVSSCAIILLILFLINRQAKSRQIENSNLESLSSNHENLTNTYPSSMRFYKMSVCFKKISFLLYFFVKEIILILTWFQLLTQALDAMILQATNLLSKTHF